MSCPNCNDNRTIMFNWEYASRNRSSEMYRYTLVEYMRKNLKYGELLVCPFCEQAWYLDENQRILSKVHDLDILRKWDSTILELRADYKEYCRRIKSLGWFSTMENINSISIPCAVETYEGEKIEAAYIVISKSPPVRGKDNRLITEIRNIFDSRYLLSDEIRCASFKAREIAMGYAPLALKDKIYGDFTINGMHDFFVDSVIDTKQLKLSDSEDLRNLPIRRSKVSQPTRFFCDWYDEARSYVLEIQQSV